MVIRTTLDLINNYRNPENESKNKKKCKKRKRDAALMEIIKYTILSSLGILLVIWSPFDILMSERLRLRKGLPPFEWWKTPPEVILVKVYVFNYTNIESFLEGRDEKLNVEEIGPIIYREIFTHKDIIFNENSTISYTINHTLKYLPELNTIDLDLEIMVPNYVALSMVTRLYKSSFIVKMGFNIILKQLETQAYHKLPIRDFLWNLTDPVMDLGRSLVPGLVPVNNIGMLHRMYEKFEDRMTIFMGTEHGHESFSLIEKINGKDTLPNYKNCKDRITNASEGVTYNQYLSKDVNIRYWRKTLCRVFELKFEKDLVYNGFDAYKYLLPPSAYDRNVDLENDCYKGSPTLPNGLSDVSKCTYNVPIAASFPHFMYGDTALKEQVIGLKGDPEKHDSFIITEPNSGIPLKSVARSQSNLVLRKLSGFPDNLTKFSELVLPMFWAEYNQEGIPLKLQILLYIFIVILKPAQIVIIVSSFSFATFYLYKFVKIVNRNPDVVGKILNTNNLVLETELFLNKNTTSSRTI